MNEQDIAVLAGSRFFGLAVCAHQGLIARGQTVSAEEQLAAGERLEAAGYLRRLSERRWEVTDEGRAVVREHDGLTPLTIDGARGMHSRDLRQIWGGDPLADRQVALRQSGASTVRSVLAALGPRPSGTGGWHLTAYVTPRGQIGYVDTARGVAVLTSSTLSDQEAEALTVPDQPEGPQVSGAAAWCAPDPGEARVASAPAGWVQLACDLRAPRGTEVEPAEAVSSETVAWGLRTCYGRLGRPGLDGLDAREPTVDVRIGASPEAVAAMEQVAERWLRKTSMQLAEMAGCRAAIEEALRQGIRSAIRAAAENSEPAPSYTPASAVVTALDCGRLSRAILRQLGVARIAGIAGERRLGVTPGGRWYDLAQHLVERVLRRDLLPHSEQLAAAMLPAGACEAEGRHRTRAWHVTVRIIPPLLAELGSVILRERLRDLPESARACEEAAYGVLYLVHGGPIDPSWRPAKSWASARPRWRAGWVW